MQHVPVLLHEAIDGLTIEPHDVVIDATLGAGGHASEIVKTHRDIKLIGFDLDERALQLATNAVEKEGGSLTAIHANFRNIEDELLKRRIKEVNKVLFDLGVSSMEFGPSGRGFSFMYDEPLLMTLATSPDRDAITAEEIVNSTREEELANIIFNYGEERLSRQIAKAIVTFRKRHRITTTFELVDIIRGAVPSAYRNGRINPATRTFQALRIATNDELGALEDGLRGAWNILAPGGRIAVITFHSLEDRIVKNLFKEFAGENGVLITKKPIVPTRAEIIANKKSRSSKLRIIEKK